MRGTQLAARAREIRDIPVLLISGYDDESLGPQQAIPPGVEFLAKPFSMDELARRMRRLMQ